MTTCRTCNDTGFVNGPGTLLEKLCPECSGGPRCLSEPLTELLRRQTIQHGVEPFADCYATTLGITGEQARAILRELLKDDR